ncbi:MAG TPA: complex I NDUFA9 subunit family protein, partial [Stellaceae bacterium]|nr:complex I NDUFA9 subunit family protein [Stellaceae bacterium]
RQLFEMILQMTARKRLLMSVPFGLASLEAWFLEWLPNPLLTRDQVRMLRHDAIAAPGTSGLAELGITPTALELILPTYLDRFRRFGRLKPSPI